MSVVYCYRGVLYFGGLGLLSSGYFSLARRNALSVEVLQLIAQCTEFFALLCIVCTIHYGVLAIVFRKRRALRSIRVTSVTLFFVFALFALFQSQFFLTFSIG